MTFKLNPDEFTPVLNNQSSSKLDASQFTPINDLRASEFNEFDTQRIEESRQRDDESAFEYGLRNIADSFERAVVSGIDLITPDDWIDSELGVKTRGTGDYDHLTDGMTVLPNRFMTPEELARHRGFIRSRIPFFKGPEPLPPTASQGNPLSGTEAAVKFVAAGTEGSADITNLIGGSVPKIASNITYSFLPSAVADAVVTETAKSLEGADLSPMTKQGILISLGVLSGGSTSASQSLIPGTLKGYTNVKNLKPTTEVNVQLDKYQQRFADRIIESDNNFSTIMEEAYKVQEALGGEPLKIIPIAAALQNDLMKNKFVQFYTDGSDPKFRATINEAVKEFETAHAKMTSNLANQSDEGITLPAAVKKEQDKRTLFETKRQEVIEKRIDQAKTKIENLTVALTKNNTKTDIGAAAKGLVNQLRADVRSRLSPMYNEWKTKAKSNDIRLSVEDTGSVYNYVDNLPLDEGKFFKSFSPLFSIKTRTAIDETTGLPEQGYSAVDLLGLKNMISGRIRDLEGATDGSSKTQRRMLASFQEGPLAAALDALPDNYGKSLKELDQMYYTEMGIPFNSAGVSKMSTAKFTTTVANDLTKLQNARDFITAVGEQGLPVLRDSIYARINSIANKSDGTVNEAKVTAWMKDPDNAELISLVPNLSNELQDATVGIANARGLIATRERDRNINAYQTTDEFLKTVGRSGIGPTVDKLIKSGGASFSDIKPLLSNMDADSEDAFRAAVRMSLVEKSMRHKVTSTVSGQSKPASVQFINQNKEVFVEFFGKGYIDEVENALKAYDIVSNTMGVVNTPVKVPPKANELLASSTGLPASEALALQRRTANKQMSKAGAAAVGASKMGNFLLEGKKEARLKDLILDPSTVTELSNLYKSHEKATFFKKAGSFLNGMKDVIVERARYGVFIGAREATLNDLTSGTLEQQKENQ